MMAARNKEQRNGGQNWVRSQMSCLDKMSIAMFPFLVLPFSAYTHIHSATETSDCVIIAASDGCAMRFGLQRKIDRRLNGSGFV